MSLCLVDIHGDIEGDYDILHNFPRNATNGDMIKDIFPSEVWLQMKAREFNKTWWNAPYKGGN